VFHYTSFEQGKLDRKSGIPARVKFDGIPLTLRPPHDCTSKEFDVFGDLKSMMVKKEGHRNSSRKSSSLVGNTSSNNNSVNDDSNRKFPNEFLFVISLPKHLLQPLKGYEDDEGLCMISSHVLSALRPQQFTDVVDGKPWADNVLLLQPHCILRSFLILPADTDVMVEYNMGMYNKNEVIHTTLDPLQTQISPITNVEVYTDRMRWIRKEASNISSGLVPLYHYTSPAVARMIMKGGLRMSGQGQGDGGVYVSTQGPASYGLGSDEYEVNIIKDCFGVERLEEYKGKGNLDIIIIYGCTAAVLEQTPGGRDNAKMVSKSTFENFSLKDVNENYFLRPDRILGVFQVNRSIHLEVNSSIEHALEMERQADIETVELLKEVGKIRSENISRVERSVKLIRSSQLGIDNQQGNISRTNSESTKSQSSNFTQQASVGEESAVSPRNAKPPLILKLDSIASMPTTNSAVAEKGGSKKLVRIGTSLDGEGTKATSLPS
jgi:hypothetical protein